MVHKNVEKMFVMIASGMFLLWVMLYFYLKTKLFEKVVSLMDYILRCPHLYVVIFWKIPQNMLFDFLMHGKLHKDFM
jgi:hypothetical protein